MKVPGAGAETPELPRYNLLEKIAAGGMATIFLAQREKSTELCVVKLIHEHLASDNIVANRFLREAQVASLLNHPNIARLTDAGREGSVFHIAMEFIAGQDLESIIQRSAPWSAGREPRLPAELSLAITLRVLDGLHYAHEHRSPEGTPLAIVHRDLSPRNVMVTYDGVVKIIDFGLARGNLGDFRTSPGTLLGTLRYMSPEQACGEAVDRRSDIYSWSVVLYEMLGGQPFIQTQGADLAEMLHEIVTKVPRPLSESNPALPPEIDRVLAKGLAKDKDVRWSTAAEYRDALAAAAEPLRVADAARLGEYVERLFPIECAESAGWIAEARGLAETALPTRVGVVEELTAKPALDADRDLYPGPDTDADADAAATPDRDPDPDPGPGPDPDPTWPNSPPPSTRARQQRRRSAAGLVAALVASVAASLIGYAVVAMWYTSISKTSDRRRGDDKPWIAPLPAPSAPAPRARSVPPDDARPRSPRNDRNASHSTLAADAPPAIKPTARSALKESKRGAATPSVLPATQDDGFSGLEGMLVRYGESARGATRVDIEMRQAVIEAYETSVQGAPATDRAALLRCARTVAHKSDRELSKKLLTTCYPRLLSAIRPETAAW